MLSTMENNRANGGVARIAGLATVCAILTIVNPRAAEAAPAPTPFELDGVAYFTASDQVNGIELGRTEGSAATTMLVADVFPGNRSSSREMW
jgi:ELWxxDGT repeat protein